MSPSEQSQPFKGQWRGAGSTSILLPGELGCMNTTAETFVGSIAGVLYVTDPKIKIMKLSTLQDFFPGLATTLVLGEINLPILCKHIHTHTHKCLEFSVCLHFCFFPCDEYLTTNIEMVSSHGPPGDFLNAHVIKFVVSYLNLSGKLLRCLNLCSVFCE